MCGIGALDRDGVQERSVLRKGGGASEAGMHGHGETAYGRDIPLKGHSSVLDNGYALGDEGVYLEANLSADERAGCVRVWYERGAQLALLSDCQVRSSREGGS